MKQLLRTAAAATHLPFAHKSQQDEASPCHQPCPTRPPAHVQRSCPPPIPPPWSLRPSSCPSDTTVWAMRANMPSAPLGAHAAKRRERSGCSRRLPLTPVSEGSAASSTCGLPPRPRVSWNIGITPPVDCRGFSNTRRVRSVTSQSARACACASGSGAAAPTTPALCRRMTTTSTSSRLSTPIASVSHCTAPSTTTSPPSCCASADSRSQRAVAERSTSSANWSACNSSIASCARGGRGGRSAAALGGSAGARAGDGGWTWRRACMPAGSKAPAPLGEYGRTLTGTNASAADSSARS